MTVVAAGTLRSLRREATRRPVASSTSDTSATRAAARGRSLRTSVCTRTVARSSDTCGVVTKVPYHATWMGSVMTSRTLR
ncbi:hypothetical protein [Mitsuaria sp. TWR114]|uniref:hypothetical protein n=1 Tax=Mitsuaria sp. TWR114 TaxID=2601731 RepID=UPI001C9A371D|nr:hypothetical protein [Mitsuaria sp. TWR114]